VSEATAAQQYYDPPDHMMNYPTCDICEDRQQCCGDPWCPGEEWDGERGWHQLCYERALEELVDEVNTIPDGCADISRIGELMTLLGVELEVKKK
jgi:hypothetical protein